MDLILPLSVRSMVCIRPLEVNIQELGSQIKQKRLCYKPFRFCLNYNFIKKITPFEKPSSLPDLHMTYLQQRPSFQEQNFYNRSAVPRDIDYRQMKTKKINILQEVRRTQISEKDFYEKIQSWIEASPEVKTLPYVFFLKLLLEIWNDYWKSNGDHHRERLFRVPAVQDPYELEIEVKSTYLFPKGLF